MIAVCVGIILAGLQFITGQERFVGFVSFIRVFGASLHASTMPPAERRDAQVLHSVRSRDEILGVTEGVEPRSGWYDEPSALNKLAKWIRCSLSRLSR